MSSGEGTPPDDGIFRGTAVEHAELMAECYRSFGWAVEPAPDDPTSYSIDASGIDDETMHKKMDECQQQVGYWTDDSPPPEYLEELYEHAKWQRECLIDLGYELSPPPSFEAFEEGRDWDPFGDVVAAAGLRPPEFFEVRDQCPYFHQWEEQQQSGGDG